MRERVIVALFAGAPATASAHLVSSGLGPFYDGALHLLLSPQDLLALLALSLLAGQSGKQAARWTAVALPLAWGAVCLFGLGLGLGAVFALSWLQIALLTLVGVMVAAGIKPPASAMAAFVLLIATVHGLGNSGAIAAVDGGAVVFAGLAATVLLLVLLTSALAVSLRAAWTRIAVRVAGSWIAASGMLMFGWLVQGRS